MELSFYYVHVSIIQCHDQKCAVCKICDPSLAIYASPILALKLLYMYLS